MITTAVYGATEHKRMTPENDNQILLNLDRLMRENDRLKKENKKLLKKNQSLKANNATLSHNPHKTLNNQLSETTEDRIMDSIIKHGSTEKQA